MNLLKDMKLNQGVEALRGVASAFALLSESVPKKADKPGTKKQTKKTQKGAVHVVNPVFKPAIGMAPSMYRRMHMGKRKIVPNYLKPHRPPRFSNQVRGVK